MSNLTETIQTVLESSIREFLSRISNKYNISQRELFDIWHGEDNREEVDPPKEEQVNDLILKGTRPILVGLCKKYGLKATGKKEELRERLLKSDLKKNFDPKKISSKKSEDVPVLKQTIISTIQISKNKYGNYVHNETGLVFSKTDKTVLGKQVEGGKIVDLQKEDIEVCNQYKFKYKLPENLNKGKKADIRIGEIDDDDEDFDSEIEEEEDDLEEFYGSGGED